MLLRSEIVKLAWQQLENDVKAGRYSEAEAVPLFRALDPLDPWPLFIEAKLALQQGDEARTQELIWQGLVMQPLRPANYFLLAKLFEESSGAKGMPLQLRSLALRVLAVGEVLSVQDHALLEREFPELAKGRDVLIRLRVEARRLRDQTDIEVEKDPRLEPLDVIVGFLELSGGGINHTAMLHLEARPQVFAAVALGAARGALLEPGRTTDETAMFLVALLGVVGDVALIPELVELAAEREVGFTAHAQWALIQLMRRYPTEGFELLSKVAIEKPAGWRTVAADVLATGPNTEPVTNALLALAEKLEDVAAEPDAGYLMVLLERELRGRSGPAEGKRMSDLAKSVLRGDAAEHHEMYAELGTSFESMVESDKLLTRSLDEIVKGRVLLDEPTPNGFEELEELMRMPDLDPVEREPMRREGAKLSRNDSCWCGSGKKYKKCHLDSDDGRRAAAKPTGSESAAEMSRRLFDRLTEFSMGMIARAEMSAVATRFFGKPLKEVEEEELEDSGFLTWLMYDYPSVKDGRSVLAEYLRRNKNVLSERERVLLEARQGAEQGIYEVTGVEPGTGIYLREHYSKNQVYVMDMTASRQVVKGGHVYQRVELFEGSFAFSGHGLLVPAKSLQPLLEWVEAERAKSGETAAAFVTGHYPEVRRFVVRSHAAASMQLRDAEGNELLVSKARYQVSDTDGLRTALGKGASKGRVWESDDEDGYSWLAVAEGSLGRRAYGRLGLSGGEMIVECMSRERLAAARADLEARSKGAIRHVEDTFKTMAESVGGVPSGTPANEVPPGVQRDIVTKYKEEHYRTWPDIALPALGGKTARQAAKTQEGAKVLDGLLRDIQQREEQERRNGRGYYDINRLRKELGLKPTK